MDKYILRNCSIIDMESGDSSLKSIVIENGKIKSVSDDVIEDFYNYNVLDIKGRYVVPGFVDCHTHLGIIEEATGKIGVDNNETSEPVTPHLRGIDAINPFDIAFGDAVRCGITTAMSGPGSNNVVGGLSAAIKTYGNVIDKMIVKSPAGFKIALGENPICTYGEESKCPVTRMATAALIRELFMRTQDYIELKKQGNIKERNIRLEAVIPVMEGMLPLRAHAHRADDIATAIRIADEFNIKKLVIEHGTEAYLIKDYLKQKNIPVAFGPLLTPRIKMELKNRKYGSVPELAEAGIKLALITDHPYNSIDQLRTVAILAASEGLSRQNALKCITTHPADILGCSERIGCIREGYDADIVAFDGDPMDINSKVAMTMISGKIAYKKDSIGS